MTNDFAIGAAMFVAAVVCVICLYKLVIKGKTKNQKFIEKAENCGNVVKGHFVDYKVSRGTETSKNSSFRYDIFIVRYEYVVNGKCYYKKLPFTAEAVVAPKYPYQVDVYYDSKNPSKAVCKQEATKSKQVKAGCLGTILITVLTMGIVYRLLLLLV